MEREEEENTEREHLRVERQKMSPTDRLHGSEPRTTADGFPDMRSLRRTGRVVQLPFRVHPQVKALMLAIRQRDNHPSMVALLEECVDAYMKIHGPIETSELPTLDELVENLERERDKRDAE